MADQRTARDATDEELMALIADGARLIALYGEDRLNRIDALILAACRQEAHERGLG